MAALLPVLGVDQSMTGTGLCTGSYAIPGGVDIYTARITTEPHDGSLKALRDRVRYIVGGVMKAAPQRCLSVIEKPIIPAHGSGLVLERAWLFGLLVDQLMTRGPVVQVHQATRAMYATGNGKAEKAEVVAAMQMSLGVRLEDDDRADAAALFAMGMRFQGAPVDGVLSKKQLSAMRSPSWPTPEEMKA